MRGSWRVWFGVAVAAALAAYACGGGDADSAEPIDDPEAGATETVDSEAGATETVDDDSEPAESVAGTEPAPEFPIGLTWFNVSEPLTFEALRGKMVLLDFWTQGCINCQHIIPDLKRLEAEFGDSLVVIGVHSGKYSEEAEDEAVAEAIARYGLEHPVVNDPAFVVWRQWDATAWPTVVLIDPRGNVVGGRAGEGVYPVFQPIMVRLHAEFEELGLIDETPISLSLETAIASTFLSFPSRSIGGRGRRPPLHRRRRPPSHRRHPPRRSRDQCHRQRRGGLRRRRARPGPVPGPAGPGTLARRQHALGGGHAQPRRSRD